MSSSCLPRSRRLQDFGRGPGKSQRHGVRTDRRHLHGGSEGSPHLHGQDPVRGCLLEQDWGSHNRGMAGGTVRLGRIAHLDNLLDWAQRILNLALDKLRRLFGSGFDAVESAIGTLIDSVVKVRERIAGRLSGPELLDRCDETIVGLPVEQVAGYLGALDRVRRNFDAWDLGFDVASTSLKWGWRISAVAPPVAIALASVRGCFRWRLPGRPVPPRLTGTRVSPMVLPRCVLRPAHPRPGAQRHACP